MELQIGIGILLDKQSFNFVRTIEMELMNYLSITDGLIQVPHITIKSPFKISIDILSSINSYIETLAQNIKQFTIGVNGFDYFEPKVAFVNVDQNDDLFSLHTQVLKDLSEKYGIPPSEFEGSNVRFHSTVALNIGNKEKFEKVKQYLEARDFPNCFTAISLGVFLMHKDQWIVIHRADLH